MRDLVALSTLPAVWIGLGRDGVARSLADVLFNTLSLDLVYIRLVEPDGGGLIEVARSQHGSDPAELEAVRECLAPVLGAGRGESPTTIPVPSGKGVLNIAVTRFGVGDANGILVTGSRNSDFPTEQDRVLLGVGANQTAIVLQRRRAEERLQEHEEWLRVTLASIGDAVIATDTEGRVTFLNAVAEELTGWAPGEAQGKPLEKVFSILNEQTGEPVENPVDKVLGKGTMVGLANHTVLVAKDGTKRPIDDSAAPIRDAAGTMIGVVLIFREVTEQRRTERVLREREQELQLVTDRAPVFLAHCDRDCRYKFVNKGYAALFGLTTQEAIGKRMPDVLGEQQYARIRQHVDAALAGKSVEFEVELPHEHDGPLVMNCAYVPEFDRDGRVEGLVAVIADVTQRKRAEDALRESRQQLDLALQAADIGQWDLRLIDRTASRNLRHDQIFGYDSLLPEWTIETFLAHVVPEDRERVDSGFQEAINSASPWDFECRIRRADGAAGWIWAKGRVFADGNGQPCRMAGTVADITERKQVEMALQDARSRLEAALEAGAIVTWTWDIPNNRIFSDKNLAKLFSLAPSEAEGGSVDQYIDAIHPDDQARVTAALRRSVESGEDYEADYRVVQPDGSVRWVVARGRAERDSAGQPVRMPGVLVDITDRKRLEEELRIRIEQLANANRHKEELLASLRESEEKLRLLANTIPQLAWMARPDGYIVWYNRRWYDYTGSSPEEMEGWGWQSVHDPEVLPKVLERWKQAISSGEPFEMVFPLKSAEGTFRPFLTRVNPLRDENGSILHWFGTNTDVSDIKRMEEALRDADRRKDEFLATLAHELRNPLAPIRTGLEVMKLAKDDPATVEEARTTMERQTQQLITLVDDLLDVSRITQGKLELRKCRVRLSDVLRSAVEASKPFIVEAGHDLTISVPEHPIYLDADPHRLAQVVSNLLNNAAKYTPEGGRIRLSAQRHGSEVGVSVKDNGIGIPAEMLDRIFEMFAQIDRLMERAYTGLGIGLTLVKSLVEMHGGRIEVHSDGRNRGSEFRVRLPILEEMPVSEPGRSPPTTVANADSRRRVLVVDDNKAAADMLGTVVKMLGNEVRTAGDGQQGIEVAAEFLPNVILMDLGMPKMNGYQAARHIRQQPWGEKMMLVALTGWGQDEDKQRTKEAGFDHHLVKPAEPAELQRLLSMAQIHES